MLRKAMLVLVLALGFLAPALASGEKEASLDRYTGGFFVYRAEGPEEAATTSYYAGGFYLYRYTGGYFVYRYTGGFFLYRRIPAVIGFFYY